MSIYIQKLIEAKAASRELRPTKGTEETPITGVESRFVPSRDEEKKLSPRARLKLASHRRRLAKRLQDVADDADEQSNAFKKGSSMKESNEGKKNKPTKPWYNTTVKPPKPEPPKSSQEQAMEREQRRRKTWEDRRNRWRAYKISQPKPPPKDEDIKESWASIGSAANRFLFGATKKVRGKNVRTGGLIPTAVGKLSDRDTGWRASMDKANAETRETIARREQERAKQAAEQERLGMPKPSMQSESKKYKHPLTAKFLAYRKGKQTEKASKALERTEKKPTNFSKKVDKLMGKKRYSDETPAEMWREIHGNAKKGLEAYKAKRDAQDRADAKKEEEEG